MSSVGLERSLPREFYLDQGVFERERGEIFQSEWFCAGRTSEIREPGDYVLRRVGGECMIVTQSRDGRLRAFHNVCRHRGAELVNCGGAGAAEMESSPHGRFPGAVRCPYHSWTYELDGALRMAPHMDEKIAPASGSLSLHRAGIETWGGFFFINVRQPENGDTRPLMQQLGPIPQRVERYPLPDLVTAKRIVYEVAANWKVILENYNECYHCGPVHPELCDIVPAFRQQGGASLDWDRGIPHREGADTFTFSGTSTRASFPGLNEHEKTLHKGELIFPNLMLSLAREHVAAFRLWPLGPDRTIVACDFLFYPDEAAKSNFDPADAVDFWDVVNRQDWKICESVQRGMHSRMFRQGYYAPMEDMSLDIRRYIYSRLGEPPGDIK